MKSIQKAAFVARRIPGRMREHNLTLVSAGVAFYAFLAFISTLIAVVSVYGLVAEPSDVVRQVDSFASALPDEVEAFISFQLKSIVESSRTGVSVTLAVSLVIALWSASGGVAALITGLHVAQEREQPRKFVVKRGKALLLTLATVVLLSIVVFLIAVLPGVVDDLGNAGETALAIIRWPVLALVMLVGVGALYRLSVRGARRGRFALFTPGAVVATLGWIVVSAGFAFYTANFAHYSRTYGSLATIVVLLLWLYLSALAILLGAEVDAVTR
jgi:membrane protein